LNRYDGIDEFIIKVIEKETAKLRGRFGIGADDLEDIHQDLHQQVWNKLAGEFSPGHPQYKAAVRRTVDSKIKDLIEHRNAEKRRTNRDNLHLEAPVESDEGEELTFADSNDLERCMEVYGDAAPSWHGHRHGKIDIQEALAALPGDLRRLADAIEALDGNLSAVERELGLTRKKLRCDLDKLRRLMRESLEM